MPCEGFGNYPLVRGERAGPLFLFEDGWLLTWQQFVEEVRGAKEAGLDCSKYCGHSFRIVAADYDAGKVAEPGLCGLRKDQVARYSPLLCRLYMCNWI